MDADHLDPEKRAREKQESRREDERALASGAKSREDLRRENGWLAHGVEWRMNLKKARRLA